MSRQAVMVFILQLLVDFIVGFDEGVNFSDEGWDLRSEALWRNRYPEEFDSGGEVDGDIIEPMRTGRKNGLRAETMRWPEAVIPYIIKGPYTLEQCQIIESAFVMYEKETCVRFRLKTDQDTDFVAITNKPGCFAELGKIGGEQTLNIAEGACVSRGTVMHELMHVLGFMHEQKRDDRDSYIKVIYENLRNGKADNFKKQSSDAITSFGVPYDYDSITHYSPMAFSKNGRPTVTLLKRAKVNIGQREHLSSGDISKVNRMYNCTQNSITRSGYSKFC